MNLKMKKRRVRDFLLAGSLILGMMLTGCGMSGQQTEQNGGKEQNKVENEKKMEIMDDSICSICYDRYNDAEQSSRGKKKNIYGEFQNDTM